MSRRSSARPAGAAGATPPTRAAERATAAERRRVLATLCVTQVVSWGVLYYAFPVALASITADTGWSASATSAAFSAGLVVSAVAGVPVGRWLDRVGPRPVMTAGSLLAAPAAAAIGLAPTIAWFVVAWLVAGVAMAAVFYQAAFAALTRWHGEDRVRALTTLTLVAGLSSTVFAPLTSLLLQQLSWRETYVALAVVLALITVPLHALALTPPWPDAAGRADHGQHGGPDETSLRSVVLSPGFLLLSCALTLTAFGMYAASLTLIPLLTGRGMSAALAATTLGLLGAGQLLGRLVYAPLAARTTPTARTVTITTASAMTIALMAVVPGPAVLLIALAVLVGAARGAATLLQATVVADRWGSARYGSLSGWFAAPITAAAALAPWAGTALADASGSYAVMFTGLALLVGLAAVIAGLSGRHHGGSPPRQSPSGGSRRGC